jgi:hypothetical protein
MFEKIFFAIVLTIVIVFLYKFRKKEFDYYKNSRYYNLLFLTMFIVMIIVIKIVVEIFKWI